MRLINLKIISGKSGSVIRDVTFNRSGLSLIVDSDTENNEPGNGIGKSTFAKVIDLCLGAKNVSSIYRDHESGSNTEVRDFLNENQVRAELIVESEHGSRHVLRRDLFTPDAMFFDDSNLDAESYKARLNSVFFQQEGPQHFRSLISFFIRQEASYDKIFRFLDPHVSDIQYVTVYETLFDARLSTEKEDVQRRIGELTKSNRKILKDLGAKQITQLDKLIEQAKQEFTDEISEVRKQRSTDSFEAEDKNAELSERIDELAGRYDDIKTSMKAFIDRKNAESEKLSHIDTDVLKLLYQDAETMLSDQLVAFEKYVEFHDAQVRDRIARYDRRIQGLQAELEDVSSQLAEAKHRYDTEFSDFRYRVDKWNDDDIVKAAEAKKRVEDLEKGKEVYISNSSEIGELKKRLQELKQDSGNWDSNTARIASSFEDITARVIGHPVSLEIKGEGFPLALNGGKLSSGEKKVLASCFGFTLIDFYRESGLERPYFFIQDAIENVAEETLSKLFEEAKSSGRQYIVPILQDRIDVLDLPKNCVILKLSHEDKLFKM